MKSSESKVLTAEPPQGPQQGADSVPQGPQQISNSKPASEESGEKKEGGFFGFLRMIKEILKKDDAYEKKFSQILGKIFEDKPDKESVRIRQTTDTKEKTHPFLKRIPWQPKTGIPDDIKKLIIENKGEAKKLIKLIEEIGKGEKNNYPDFRDIIKGIGERRSKKDVEDPITFVNQIEKVVELFRDISRGGRRIETKGDGEMVVSSESEEERRLELETQKNTEMNRRSDLTNTSLASVNSNDDRTGIAKVQAADISKGKDFASEVTPVQERRGVIFAENQEKLFFKESPPIGVSLKQVGIEAKEAKTAAVALKLPKSILKKVPVNTTGPLPGG